jgi:DNA-binding NarL/FixJ family response regulator
VYRIAVIDDDEYWCFAIQRYLRKEFEVQVITDVQYFLQNQERFDLVIVDFAILPQSRFEPLLNGCELIGHLKKKFEPPPLAVLASGFISKNDIRVGEKLCPGADAFLAKDAGLEAVAQVVHQLLANKA